MSVRAYQLPSTQTDSADIELYAGGVRIPVSECYVSAYPYNRRWPGHQRQESQREKAYFVRFETDGQTEIRVKRAESFENVVVRPLSRGITVNKEDGCAVFNIPGEGGYSVEFDGYANALHIFADCPHKYGITESTAGVLWYGEGEHHIGKIELKSNQTLYIGEGAVVYATVFAKEAENVRILGKGILDNSESKEEILYEVKSLGDGSIDVGNSRRDNTIDFVNCRGVEVDGITIRDSLCYNISAHGCSDMNINNVKIIGCWRYNSDGIDFHNCTHCRVTGCFVRTFDDSICVKGHDGYPELCSDIITQHCVVWCDWDHALEIGAETRAENMCNIVFRDCDVIRSLGVALDIYNIDYGHVHDVLYDDIRVEYDDVCAVPRIQPDDETPYDTTPDNEYISTLIAICISHHHEYSSKTDTRRGRVSGVVFRNIRVYSKRMPHSFQRGYDAEHMCKGLVYDGIYLNNEKLPDITSARIVEGEYTDKAKFIV